MRLGKAVGIVVVTLAVAGAAVAWAPDMAAQQQSSSSSSSSTAQSNSSTPKPAAGTQVQKKTMTVTVDDQNGQRHVMVNGEPMDAGGQNFAFSALGVGGPRLGVQIRDVTKDDVTKMKLSSPSGSVVEDVTKDSAAAKAGLKSGDVIVQFDGEAVRSAKQLTRLVGETSTEHPVKIGVMRDGKRMDVDATLTSGEPLEIAELTRAARSMADAGRVAAEAGRQSAEAGRQSAGERREEAQKLRQELEQRRLQLRDQMSELRPMLRDFQIDRGNNGVYTFRGPNGAMGNFTFRGPDGMLGRLQEGPFGLMMGESRGRLGVTVQELTPDLATFFGVKDGVLVSSVAADSPAAKAGIKAGDVITGVNDKPIGDGSALVAQLANKVGDVTIVVTRDKKALSLKATLPKPEAPKRKTVLDGEPARP